MFAVVVFCGGDTSRVLIEDGQTKNQAAWRDSLVLKRRRTGRLKKKDVK
jgi:hypothetical protein